MINTREFLDALRSSIKAGLESAGFRAIYQDPQSWAGSFHVSNSNSQGSVSFSYGRVCENCGETIAYRVVSANGTFGNRVSIPKESDAATIAGHLIPAVLPLLTNRLPAAKSHDPHVGVGLLTPQAARDLSDALVAGAH